MYVLSREGEYCSTGPLLISNREKCANGGLFYFTLTKPSAHENILRNVLSGLVDMRAQTKSLNRDILNIVANKTTQRRLAVDIPRSGVAEIYVSRRLV